MRAARAARNAENDITTTTTTNTTTTTAAATLPDSSRVNPCRTGSGRPRPSPPMKWKASGAPSSETTVRRRRVPRRVGARVNERAATRGSSSRDDARQRSNNCDGAITAAMGRFPPPYPGIDGPRPSRPATKSRANLPGRGATRIIHEDAKNKDDVAASAARPKYSRKRPRSAIAQKLTAAVPSAPRSMGAEVVVLPTDSRRFYCGDDSQSYRTGEERCGGSNCQGEYHQRKRNARPASAPLGRSQDAKALLGLSQMIDGSYSKSPGELRIMKWVVLREIYVDKLRGVLAARRGHPKYAAAKRGCSARGRTENERESLLKLLVELLAVLRRITVEIIEAVERWRGPGGKRPFLWGSSNYLLKVVEDVAFLGCQPGLEEHVGVYIGGNPLLCHVGLDGRPTFRPRGRGGEGEELGVDPDRFLASASLGVSADRLEAATEVLRREVNLAGRAIPGANDVSIPVATFQSHETRCCPDNAADKRTSRMDRTEARSTGVSLRSVGSDSDRSVGCGDRIASVCSGHRVEGSERAQSQRESPGWEARIPDTLSFLDMKPDVRDRGPEPVIQEDTAESCEEREGGTSQYRGMPPHQRREIPEAVIGEAQQSKPGLPSGESSEESVAFQSVGARDDCDSQREQHHGAVDKIGGFEAVGISSENREGDSFCGTHQESHRTEDRRRDTEEAVFLGTDKAGGPGNHTTRDEDVAREPSPFQIIHTMCDGLLTNLHTTGLSGCAAGGSMITPAACTDHCPAELPQGGCGGVNSGPQAAIPSSKSSPMAGGLSCHGSNKKEYCSRTTTTDCRAENREGAVGSQEGRKSARGVSNCPHLDQTMASPRMSADHGDIRCENPEEEEPTERRNNPRSPEHKTMAGAVTLSTSCQGNSWREMPASHSDRLRFDVRHGLNALRIHSRGHHIEAQDRPELEATCSRWGLEDRAQPQRAWQGQSDGASGAVIRLSDVQEALEGDGARAAAALPREERTSDEARLYVEGFIGHMIRQAMEDVIRPGSGETARSMTWTKGRRSRSESILPEEGSPINDSATGIARCERGEGSPGNESMRATGGVGAKTSCLAPSGEGSARAHQETGAGPSGDARRSTHNGSASHLASPLYETEGNDYSSSSVHDTGITNDGAAIDSFNSAAIVLQHAWRAAREARAVRKIKNGEKVMRRPRRSRDTWSNAASRIVRAWRSQRPARSRSRALSQALSEAAGDGDLRAVAFILREKERQCLGPSDDGDAISSCRGQEPDAVGVRCPQSQNDSSAAGGIQQIVGLAGRKRDLDRESQLWLGQTDASEFAEVKATDGDHVPAAAAREAGSFGKLAVALGVETDPISDCVKYRETTPPTMIPPRELSRDRLQHAHCRREMERVEKAPAQDGEFVASRDTNADGRWKEAGHLAIDYCNADRAVLLQPVETIPAACCDEDAIQGEKNHHLRGEKRSAESSRTDEAGDTTDAGCSRYLGAEEGGESLRRAVEHLFRGRAKESDGAMNISAECEAGGNSDGAEQADVPGGERRGQGHGETRAGTAPAQSGPEKHDVGGLATDKGLPRHAQEEPLSTRFRDNDKERPHRQQGLEGSGGGVVTRKEVAHTDPCAGQCEQILGKVEKRSKPEETRSASSLKGRGGREEHGGQSHGDERGGIIVGDALDVPSPYRDCVVQDGSGDARHPQGGDSVDENDNHAELRSLAWDGVPQGKAKYGCEVSECSLDEPSASAGADELGGGKVPEDAPEEWRDEDDAPPAASEADERQQQTPPKIQTSDEEATYGPPPAPHGNVENCLPDNDSKVARLLADSVWSVRDHRDTTLVVDESGSDGEAPKRDRPEEMIAQVLRGGWVSLFDQDSGCWYYLDRESGLTQWEEPPDFGVKGVAASDGHPGEEIGEEAAVVQAEVVVRS